MTKIDDLVAAVEQDHFSRALRETSRGAKSPDVLEEETRRKKRKQGKEENKQNREDLKGPKSSLWVDKYAPSTFLDLLSDERINRDVVRWMKQWDPCVFGTEIPVRSSEEKDKASDPYHRPEEKLILVSGPPGLGKTTLAHVVARHCGYRVTEINASDERNGQSLISRVQDASEMQSVMGEKRPNCIVIDEIDGAAGGSEATSAVSALVRLANAGAPRKSQNQSENDAQEDELSQSKAKKKKGMKPLLRPIICICNDLYAPALRPLRECARVFMVKPPTTERLVERLRYICNKEGLRAEKSTLRALADRAEGDIRACLNTLQFISKKQDRLRITDVSSVGIGQKDITMSAYRLWKDLLHVKV